MWLYVYNGWLIDWLTMLFYVTLENISLKLSVTPDVTREISLQSNSQDNPNAYNRHLRQPSGMLMTYPNLNLMGFHFEVICSLQKPTRLNHFSKCFLRFKESGEVSTYSYDAESEIIYNFRFLRSGCFSPKVLFSYTKLQYFLSIFYYILSYTNFKFNIKEIHNASYTVLMSYCKFWIYWVGVNTKFTIWHWIEIRLELDTIQRSTSSLFAYSILCAYWKCDHSTLRLSWRI